MKKLTIIIIALFIINSIDARDIQNQLAKWKAEIELLKAKNPEASNIDYKTEQYYKFLQAGSKLLPELMENYKLNNGPVGVLFFGITKVVFKSHFNEQEKYWAFDDYPEYVYYPPAFHSNPQNQYKSIWLYWWEEGRKLTPKLFAKKYESYLKAQKEKKQKEIKKYFEEVKNLGIVAFPQLLAKIQAGDTSLIPIFSYWSNAKVPANASVKGCVKWWKENKKDYEAILNYDSAK